MLNALYLICGIALLFAGGELLIRGALSGAKRLGVSPLLIGLVVVGFGTSAPELVVSVDAALNAQPDIAIGNIVGSNISNTLLILGLCAFISLLPVRPLALRRDAVTTVVGSVIFIILATSADLGRIDSLILLTCFVAYLVWAYLSERGGETPAAEVHADEAEEITAVPKSLLSTAASIVVGLAFLIGGSQLLLLGAVALAEIMGVPEAVIGLPLVAVWTSLPELSISVIAAIRGHLDVAVGNVLGSNIFNLLGILGISAALQPLVVHARILQLDQWVLLGSALITLLFLYTGRRLNRWEGAALLVGYVAYIGLSFTVFGG